MYVLNQLSNEGHCFAYKEQLIEEAGRLLEVEAELIEEAIGKMLEEGSLIADRDEALYLPVFYHSETGAARRIKRIVETDSIFIHNDVEKMVAIIEKQNRVRYDEAQREAIKKAGSRKFTVLTGGPGTGKTFTTLGIISLYRMLGLDSAGCSHRQGCQTHVRSNGMEAKTIHRLLEYKPAKGYTVNEEKP